VLSAKGLEEMHTKHGNCKESGEKTVSALGASSVRGCVSMGKSIVWGSSAFYRLRSGDVGGL